MKKDFGLAVEAAERVGVKLALGEEGLRAYEETSRDPECRDLDSRVVFRYLGGREDWREGFPEEVEMKKEETRRLLQRGKEMEKENEVP
jgi:3-hydroxyisobutyrate dehydrogenase